MSESHAFDGWHALGYLVLVTLVGAAGWFVGIIPALMVAVAAVAVMWAWQAQG